VLARRALEATRGRRETQGHRGTREFRGNLDPRALLEKKGRKATWVPPANKGHLAYKERQDPLARLGKKETPGLWGLPVLVGRWASLERKDPLEMWVPLALLDPTGLRDPPAQTARQDHREILDLLDPLVHLEEMESMVLMAPTVWMVLQGFREPTGPLAQGDPQVPLEIRALLAEMG